MGAASVSTTGMTAASGSTATCTSVSTERNRILAPSSLGLEINEILVSQKVT